MGLVGAGALTALTSLAVLVVLPARTGGTGGAGAAERSGAAAPTWVRYFFPLKVGWTCHESLEATGATGAETLTVASVGRTSRGRSVTITEGSSSTADGVSVPTNAALHYVLTTGGQLVSVPSGIQVGGQPYSIDGTTTYPDVQTLLSGGSAVSRLHIAVPLSAADRAELQAVLPAGATALDMAVAVQQSGRSVAVLQTPMGTFHHLLSVRSVLKSIAFTNVSKAASRVLAGAVKPTIAKELTLDAVYAPGVGPIKIAAAGYTGFLTSCGPS
jgi:hypothetical protein